MNISILFLENYVGINSALSFINCDTRNNIMMINMNYAQMVSSAQFKSASQVDLVKNREHTLPVAPKTDTVTLSDAALAKINGQDYTASTPTYIKPETAKSLIAANKVESSTVDDKAIDTRFGDMMQSILDKRLGIDRDALAELEAMIEEIAKNENMSPEEKQKAIEQLEKMREEIIEKSLENKATAKQTFEKNDEK